MSDTAAAVRADTIKPTGGSGEPTIAVWAAVAASQATLRRLALCRFRCSHQEVVDAVYPQCNAAADGLKPNQGADGSERAS